MLAEPLSLFWPLPLRLMLPNKQPAYTPSMASKTPTITVGESSFRPDAPPFEPLRSWEIVPSASTDGVPPANDTVASLKRGPPPESDEEAAKRLKLTVLTPFFTRIKQHGEENARLRLMNTELAAMNERQKRALSGVRYDAANESAQQLLLEAPDPRGMKRKASAPPVSPMKVGSRENGENEHITEGHLLHLANQICNDLDELVPNEQIHLCGLGPLKIMESRPDEVLDLAHQKLHTWPFKSIPMCWRRLYEDATLSKAASMLCEEAERISGAVSFKRRRLDGEKGQCHSS